MFDLAATHILTQAPQEIRQIKSFDDFRVNISYIVQIWAEFLCPSFPKIILSGAKIFKSRVTARESKIPMDVRRQKGCKVPGSFRQEFEFLRRSPDSRIKTPALSRAISIASQLKEISALPIDEPPLQETAYRSNPFQFIRSFRSAAPSLSANRKRTGNVPDSL